MCYVRTAVLLALVPTCAWAEDKSRPPVTLAPQVCLATAHKKDDTIQVCFLVPRMIPIQVTRQVPSSFVIPNEEGKPEIVTTFRSVTETFYKALVSEVVLIADGKEVRASRKDGKVVDPQELPKLLNKQAPVLVFTQGEIDPYYLQVVQDEVLIIVIPASKDFPGRPKADK